MRIQSKRAAAITRTQVTWDLAAWTKRVDGWIASPDDGYGDKIYANLDHVAFRGLDAEQAARQLKVPLLLIASEGDVNTVMAARWIEHVAESDPTPPRVLIFPGSDHGTRMLRGSQGKRVEAVIFQFLKEHGGTGTEPGPAPADR